MPVLIADHLVAIVPDQEWVSVADAQAALGLRSGWLNIMVMNGDLERAATHPRPWTKHDIGVTAASLRREVAWWAAASAPERRRRKRRLLLKNGLNSI